MATNLHPFDDTQQVVLPSYQKSSALPSGQTDLDSSNFFWKKWRLAGAVALLWLALSYALHVPAQDSSSQQMGWMMTEAEGILPSSTASVPLLGKSSDDSNHHENHHTNHHTNHNENHHTDHHIDGDKVITKERKKEEKKRQKEEKEADKTREKDPEKEEKTRQKEEEKAQETLDKEKEDIK